MNRLRIPLLASTAGALLVTGALLPWVSLFAGLQTMAGTTGAYGRVLLAGGVALIAVAVVSLRVRPELFRWVTGLAGGALLLPAGLALLGQRTLADADPMLVLAPGPGPWVAAAGAALAFTALFLPPTAPAPSPTEDRERTEDLDADHLAV